METTKIKITDSQKNSISSVLLILNEIIDEIEELCRNTGRNSILYNIVNNLSEQEIKEILTITDTIKGLIKQIVKQFNIKRIKYDTKHLISSRISSLWEMVCEIESKRLKGYGEVSKSLRENLDPAVSKIIQLLNEIGCRLYKK
jgi:hypothetical protein